MLLVKLKHLYVSKMILLLSRIIYWLVMCKNLLQRVKWASDVFIEHLQYPNYDCRDVTWILWNSHQCTTYCHFYYELYKCLYILIVTNNLTIPKTLNIWGDLTHDLPQTGMMLLSTELLEITCFACVCVCVCVCVCEIQII